VKHLLKPPLGGTGVIHINRVVCSKGHGYKFRRQHPIGLYIADFYCHKAKLVIEVDGSIHNLNDIKEFDEIRENELVNRGYTVLRFTNQQVMERAEEVLKIISERILELNNLQKQNTLRSAEFKIPL
jgi:very-short-patch-repair endonuclease